MKKHNLLKVVLISVLVVILLSWIIPVTTFDTTLVKDGRVEVGLFTIVNDFGIVIQYFMHVGIYILVVGGFYGVLHNISGYRNLLDKIVKKFNGREWAFLVLSIVLISVITAMVGLGLAVLFLFPFVVSIVLLMGYDKITASMVTAGSVAVGLMGTVFSMPMLETQADEANQLLSTSVLSQVLGTTATTEWVSKIVILLLGISILAYNAVRYAKEHRNTKELEKGSYIPLSNDKKQITWPVMVLMDVLFVIMILAFLSWTSVFGIDLFENVTKAVLEFEVFKYPIFGKLLGPINAFGHWSLYDFSVVLILVSFITAFIYRIKFNDIMSGFIAGAKRAIKPAVLVCLIYFILVVTATTPYILTIVKPVLALTNGFNIATTAFAAMVTSLFGTDLYYAAPFILQYSVSLIGKSTEYLPLVSLIWQSMFGLVMLIAPTSVILFATLSYLHVPYGQWIKSIWKVFVELLLVVLVVFVVIFAFM